MKIILFGMQLFLVALFGSVTTLSSNIQVMEVSSGGAYCDQADESSCAIVIELEDGGTIRGESKGTVRSSN